MGENTVDSFSKVTTNYDEPSHSASPSLPEAIVALPSLKPIYHRGFDSLRRWRRHWAANLLHKPLSEGRWDPLSHGRKCMLSNRLCVAKTTPLLLSLRGTFDDEIPRDQSASPTTYSVRQNISMSITAIIIWLEGENTQGGEKLGHSKLVGSNFRRKGVHARW